MRTPATRAITARHPYHNTVKSLHLPRFATRRSSIGSLKSLASHLSTMSTPNSPIMNTSFIKPSATSPLATQRSPLPTTLPPTALLVHISHIALNPADIKMIDSGHRVTRYPFIPGLDGAGTVHAVGSSVSRFRIGDEVLGMFAAGSENGGSYQTYAVVEEGMVAKKPDSWSREEAASLSVCFFTAMVGLGAGLGVPLSFVEGGANDGFRPKSVLVLGGSSALGAAAVQLLKVTVPGITVLATASVKHHQWLKGLGVNASVDRASKTLVQDVKRASPEGTGVDAIFDAVGAGATERQVFETFTEAGPKKYAQVWTGDDEIAVPNGVESVLFRSRDFMQIPGGKHIMLALQTVLEEAKYRLPLPVRHVGHGLEGLESGLGLMRKGVSGEKLVVAL